MPYLTDDDRFFGTTLSDEDTRSVDDSVPPEFYEDFDVPKLYDRCAFADGFTVSIQANQYMYCEPRRQRPTGGFTHVELGFPTEADSLLTKYAEDPENPTETVYGYVPARVVRALIAKHGGIVEGECPPLSMGSDS